jgi:hypothetical protein
MLHSGQTLPKLHRSVLELDFVKKFDRGSDAAALPYELFVGQHILERTGCLELLNNFPNFKYF